MTETSTPRNLIFSHQRLWIILGTLTLLMMESVYASLWYRVIFVDASVAWVEVWGVLFAILAGSLLLAWVLFGLRMRPLIRQALFLGWIGAAIFGSMKLFLYPYQTISLYEMASWPIRYITLAEDGWANFFHLVGVALLIWRGVSLARASLSVTGAQVSFQLGLVFLLLYGMFFAQTYPAASTAGLYIFLLSGLVAMSAARIGSLQGAPGGRPVRFSAGWLLGVALAALAVVGVGVLLGWVTSGSLVALLVRGVVVILTLLTALLFILLTPLLLVLARAIPAMAEIFQQLINRFSGIHLPKFLEDLTLRISQAAAAIVPMVLTGRQLFLVGLVVGILVLILLSLRWWHMAMTTSTEEEAEGIGQVSLRELWQRMRNRQRSRAGPRSYSPGQLVAAMRIRQIYRQMMALSQQLGAARPPACTPLEFLPQLERLFPNSSGEVNRITQAYLKVRYGQYPESSQEVEEVQNAWKAIRQQGKQKKRQKRGNEIKK